MQSSHSDWCSFVVLHFVNDVYFSVSFICVLLCSERKITLTDKQLNKSLNVYLIFITIYKKFS